MTLSPDMRRQLEEQSERDPLLHNLMITLDSIDRENWTADSMASAMLVLSRELERRTIRLAQFMNRDVPVVTILERVPSVKPPETL